MTLRLSPDAVVAQSESPLLGIAGWWKRCRLGDITEVTNGAPFKSANFNVDGNGMPLIRIRDVGQAETATYYSGKYEDRHLVNSGDLLVGMDGDFRVARWLGKQSLLNQRVCRLRIETREHYSDHFLEYALQPYLDEIHKATSSVTVKHLSSKTISDLPIPLPPRVEQERLVAVIEEHFSRLDAAEATLRQTLQRLDSLRSSILADAFHANREPPNGWQNLRLEDLLEHSIGGLWGSPAGEDEHDVDVIRVTELEDHGTLSMRTAASRSITKRQLSSRLLRVGDLVLEKSGGGPTTPVGRVARFPGHTRDAICTNFMQLMRPHAQLVASGFLHWQLHYRYVSGATATLNKGSGNIRNLATKEYLRQSVTLPPIHEQVRISCGIEELFAQARELELAVSEARAKLAGLRSSLLAAAFSGRLVTQDPDDEPASVLLERIAALRAAEPAHRRSRS